jgi:hypothetical protein
VKRPAIEDGSPMGEETGALCQEGEDAEKSGFFPQEKDLLTNVKARLQ